MAHALGYNAKLYIDGFDRSADTTDITAGAMADTIDVTPLGSSGWKQFLATLKGGEVNFNFMWDPAVGAIGPQLVALLGLTTIVTINLNEAGAVGDSALVLPPSVLNKLSPAIKPADIIRMPVTLKVTDAVGLAGNVHQPATLQTVVGAAASIDNLVQTTAGGRANFNFTGITGGAARMLIEDSADNITFATIADSGSIAAIGGVSIPIAGTIRRYTRARLSVVATNVTALAALARY